MRIQLQTDVRYREFIGRSNVRTVLGNEMRVACVEDVLQGKVWAYLDEAAFQIDILNTQPHAFHQTEPAAVKHFRHQQVCALHLPEDPLDLGLGHDDRRAGPPFGADRLVLLLYRLVEHSFFFPHLGWMGVSAVEFDIAEDPVAIALLGTVGIMVVTQHLAPLVH